MTARLPTVSGDSNAWGTILNTYLGVSHNSDGTLSNRPVNLKDYCVIDGATDDSPGFTTAYTLASTLGVGLYMPGGTLVKGNDTLLPLVPIDLGGGTIKLKNGANTDLFSAQTSSINLAAGRATGSDGTLYGFSIKNGTLDGNKANQTSGPSWCLRFYGYGFTLENLECVNGFSGCALMDWNGTGIHNHNGVEAKIRNFHCHNAGNALGTPGLQMGGPHDSQITNLICSENFGMGLHLAPNAVGIQIDNFHAWGNFGTGIPGVLIEGGDNQITNAVFESPSDTTQYHIILAARQNHIHGKCVSSGAFSGIQLGQNSGETPIAGQILQSAGVTTYNPCDGSNIDMLFEACTGTNGAINFDKVHYSKIKAVTIQASGSAYTGFLDPTNQYELLPPNGLTPDGSVGKGGQTRISANSQSAFTVGSDAYLDYLNIVTHSNPRFEMPNGVYLQFYSDQYATVTSALRTGIGAPSSGVGNNGDYYFRSDTPGTAYQQLYIRIAGAWVPFIGAPIQSATTPDPGAGGTITTAGVTVARVTPAASRTGVILQAGTVAGQKCTVVNNSGSFTITFAASGTSHIADGVSDSIAVNGAASYTWDGVAALWYRG